jgi:uncharacterized membrane protein YuzA (DUF378 family)
MNQKILYEISEWSLIVGGLHIGLMAFTDISVLGYIPEVVMPVVYGLIGVSAIYQIYYKVMKK